MYARSEIAYVSAIAIYSGRYFLVKKECAIRIEIIWYFFVDRIWKDNYHLKGERWFARCMEL